MRPLGVFRFTTQQLQLVSPHREVPEDEGQFEPARGERPQLRDWQKRLEQPTCG